MNERHMEGVTYYLSWQRWENRRDGDPEREDLEHVTADDVRRVFNLPPEHLGLGLFRVEAEHVSALQELTKHQIDLETHSHYVGFTRRRTIGPDQAEAFGFWYTDRECYPEERFGQVQLAFWPETFQSCIGAWQTEDYERMWRVGAERALCGQPSAMITSYAGPHKCIFLNWWPLYDHDGQILMQQRPIFERPKEWHWERLWEQMDPEPGAHSNDEDEDDNEEDLCGWQFPRQAVQDWLAERKRASLSPCTAVDPGSLSTRDAAAFSAATTHLDALTEDWERERFDGFIAVDLESSDLGWLITFQARRGVENGSVEDLRACEKLLYVEADDLRVHALTDAEFRNGVQRLEAEIALGRDLLDRDATAPDLSKSLQTKLTKAFPASDASTSDEATARSANSDPTDADPTDAAPSDAAPFDAAPSNAELATRLLRGFTPAFTERHGRAPWPRLTLTILSKSAGDLPRLRANLGAALEDWRNFVGNMPEG